MEYTYEYDAGKNQFVIKLTGYDIPPVIAVFKENLMKQAQEQNKKGLLGSIFSGKQKKHFELFFLEHLNFDNHDLYSFKEAFRESPIIQKIEQIYSDAYNTMSNDVKTHPNEIASIPINTLISIVENAIHHRKQDDKSNK